jgi:glucosamine 6-phosphate synthetase-like amidotransferase/phosphosugar isomerase protein
VNTVYVIGHGTSYATALNGESFFSHISRLCSRALPAFQFSRYIDDFIIRPEKTLVIGISSGGNTPSVIKGLEEAASRGAVTVCLSGNGDIGCAKVARYRIITDSHREGKKVKVYTISHIFLLLGAYRLAILLGRRNGNLDRAGAAYWEEQLDQLIAAMKCLPNLLDRMEDISSAVTKLDIQNFAVLGTGPNIGTMTEGALKVSEMSWLFGAGEELEDFAHGRFREVDSKIPLFIISPSGKAPEKTLDVLAGCAVSGTPSIVLTDEVTPALKKLAPWIVEMPKLGDEYLTPFLYIFPFWFFGYHFRKAAGKLAGEVRHNLLAADINFKAHFNESGEKIT